MSDVKTLVAVDDTVYGKCQKYDHGAYGIVFDKTTTFMSSLETKLCGTSSDEYWS